jgi:hypothetical protein
MKKGDYVLAQVVCGPWSDQLPKICEKTIVANCHLSEYDEHYIITNSDKAKFELTITFRGLPKIKVVKTEDFLGTLKDANHLQKDKVEIIEQFLPLILRAWSDDQSDPGSYYNKKDVLISLITTCVPLGIYMTCCDLDHILTGRPANNDLGLRVSCEWSWISSESCVSAAIEEGCVFIDGNVKAAQIMPQLMREGYREYCDHLIERKKDFLPMLLYTSVSLLRLLPRCIAILEHAKHYTGYDAKARLLPESVALAEAFFSTHQGNEREIQDFCLQNIDVAPRGCEHEPDEIEEIIADMARTQFVTMDALIKKVALFDDEVVANKTHFTYLSSPRFAHITECKYDGIKIVCLTDQINSVLRSPAIKRLIDSNIAKPDMPLNNKVKAALALRSHCQDLQEKLKYFCMEQGSFIVVQVICGARGHDELSIFDIARIISNYYNSGCDALYIVTDSEKTKAHITAEFRAIPNISPLLIGEFIVMLRDAKKNKDYVVEDVFYRSPLEQGGHEPDEDSWRHKVGAMIALIVSFVPKGVRLACCDINHVFMKKPYVNEYGISSAIATRLLPASVPDNPEQLPKPRIISIRANDRCAFVDGDSPAADILCKLMSDAYSLYKQYRKSDLRFKKLLLHITLETIIPRCIAKLLEALPRSYAEITLDKPEYVQTLQSYGDNQQAIVDFFLNNTALYEACEYIKYCSPDVRNHRKNATAYGIMKSALLEGVAVIHVQDPDYCEESELVKPSTMVSSVSASDAAYQGAVQLSGS